MIGDNEGVAFFGGPWGNIAFLEDADVIAQRLRTAVHMVEQVGACADRAVDRLEAGHFGDFMWTIVVWTEFYRERCLAVRRAQEAITSWQETTLHRVKRELEELIAKLEVAAADYEEAERYAMGQFSTWESIRSRVINSMAQFGPLGWLAGVAGAAASAVLGVPGYLVENGRWPSWGELLRSHQADLTAVVGGLAVPGFQWEPPSTSTASRGLGGLVLMLTGPDNLSFAVKRVSQTATGAPAGMGDVTQRILDLARSRSEDTTKIGITKVVSKAGAVSWLVTIPGTATPDITSPNPAGMLTNFLAVAGDPNVIGLATCAALRDAGAKKGEPVVLAGHSQGGIVSAQLAADEDFNSLYSVAGILTLGSPIGAMKPPVGQQWMSIEHVQDPVPALSPTSEYGSRHTAVIRDLAEASDEDLHEAQSDPEVAHTGSTYRATAELVDGYDDGNLAAWREAVAPVMDGEATATVTEYEISVR
ncbi:MAG: GPI inositol-deacylase [Bifidobacteriaceae bacterium]|jgi:hypothetical protein|nr:GPI inositol-deacylase [Bifidobacteriaceae bacterium]